LREHSALVEKNQRINKELQDQMAANTRLLAENSHKALLLREKDDAIRAVQEETLKVMKAKEAAFSNYEALQRVKEKLDRQTDDIRHALATCTKHRQNFSMTEKHIDTAACTCIQRAPFQQGSADLTQNHTTCL
jgi:gamma-glutamylcysteine synthetase